MEIFKYNPIAEKTYNYFKKINPEQAEQFLENFTRKILNNPNHSLNKEIKEEIKEETQPLITKPKIEKPLPIKRQTIQTTLSEHPLTIAEIAKKLNLSENTILARIREHGIDSPLVYEPRSRNKPIEMHGKKQSLNEWSKELKVPRINLYRHYVRHGNLNKFLESQKKIENEEVTLIRKIAEKFDIKYNTALYRVKKYGPPEKWPKKFFRSFD